MFDLRQYYSDRNQREHQRYRDSLGEVSRIADEASRRSSTGDIRGELYRFFAHTASWVLSLAELEERLGDDYFTSLGFDQLREQNRALSSEILPEPYRTSYANPAYAVERFGQPLGQLLSHFYLGFRQYKWLATSR